jgi:GNAT superfamily N-acetyltransferase
MLSFAPWDEHEIRVERMDGQPSAGFDCGRQPQNDFLYTRAWRDQKAGVSVTYLLYAKGILAGFVTVLASKIDLGPGERLPRVFWREVPAIKIAQLAVDRRFAGQGLGKLLVSFGIQLARRIRFDVGCRVVTLEAQPDLVTWYEHQAFRASMEEQRMRVERAHADGRQTERLPVSMRFDLREAGR